MKERTKERAVLPLPCRKVCLILTLLLLVAVPAFSSSQERQGPDKKQAPYSGQFTVASLSPTKDFLQNDILFPFATAAGTGFLSGFVHEYISGRYQGNAWLRFAPALLAGTLHFFMKPALDHQALLRILPDLGDGALSLAYGPYWAGALTPWIRYSLHMAAGMEILWPELQREWQMRKHCQYQPVTITGDDTITAEISVTNCIPDEIRSSENSLAYHLDLTININTPSPQTPLGDRLIALKEHSQNEGIQKLMLIPAQETADSPLILQIFQKKTTGWDFLHPAQIIIESEQFPSKQLDINSAEHQLFHFPPVETLLEKLDEVISHNAQQTIFWEGIPIASDTTVDDKTEPGTDLLFIEGETSRTWMKAGQEGFWLNQARSLPTIVVQANHNPGKSYENELAKIAGYSPLPQRYRIPWRIVQLAMFGVVHRLSGQVGSFLSEKVFPYRETAASTRLWRHIQNLPQDFHLQSDEKRVNACLQLLTEGEGLRTTIRGCETPGVSLLAKDNGYHTVKPNSSYGYGQNIYLAQNRTWDTRYGPGSQNAFESLQPEQQGFLHDLRSIVWLDTRLPQYRNDNDIAFFSSSSKTLQFINARRSDPGYKQRIFNEAIKSGVISNDSAVKDVWLNYVW